MTQGWQPISTAPKDGTEVVLGCWDYTDQMSRDQGWRWHQVIGSWSRRHNVWVDWTHDPIGNSYTHWLQKADPPKNEANPLKA